MFTVGAHYFGKARFWQEVPKGVQNRTWARGLAKKWEGAQRFGSDYKLAKTKCPKSRLNNIKALFILRVDWYM
jgi:hypothetical protein